MQKSNLSMFIFLILVVGAALFVWYTSRSLPEIVASHFGASGAANGFMPRSFYVKFFLAVIVGAPLAVVFLPARALNSPSARINLPNREYWLAPERREETIEVLRGFMTQFGSMLVVFLCYAHWLVVLANNTVPPILPSSKFIGGLVIFLGIIMIWIILLLGRFRNIPR
jgi:uncharacterized membrane protein